MLRGGSVLSATQNASSANQLSTPGVDSRLVKGFSSQFNYNSSIARSETIELLPQSNPLLNQTVTWVQPSSNSTGVFYDLSKSFVQVNFTNADPAGASHQVGFQKYFASNLLFSNCSVTLNGVRVDNEAVGNEHFSQATLQSLMEPYDSGTDSNFLGHEHTVAANGDVGTDISNGAAVKMSSRNYNQGLLSVPPMFGYLGTRGGNPRQRWVDQCQDNSSSFIAQQYHPLFNSQQDTLIPATYDLALTLTKRDVDFASACMQTDSGDTVASYTPTCTGIHFYIKRVVLSVAGLDSYTKMLNASAGLIRIDCPRTVCTQYQLASGSSSIQISQLSSRKPRSIAIWFTPSATQTIPPPSYSHPLSCTQPTINNGNVSFSNGEGAVARIQSLYVRINGQQYPRDYQIARANNTTNKQYNHGGTLHRDYENYKELCQQMQTAGNEVQPFWSEAGLAGNACSLFFINLEDNESGYWGERQPVIEQSNIEIIGSTHSALGYPVQMTVVALHQESVFLQNGSVRKTW